MLASPHTVMGPRTQSRLSSATVCLLTRRFVVIRKGGKKADGGCSWSQGLEYGNTTGPEAWTLGREQEREQGVPLEPGGLGLRLGLGLLCNVNPWGIRSCNRRGEVAARSLACSLSAFLHLSTLQLRNYTGGPQQGEKEEEDSWERGGGKKRDSKGQD